MADVDSLLAKEGYFIKFRSLLRHFFYDRCTSGS